MLSESEGMSTTVAPGARMEEPLENDEAAAVIFGRAYQ